MSAMTMLGRGLYSWTCQIVMLIFLSIVAQELVRPFTGVWHPIYLAILNGIGPSTEYHRPRMPTAVDCGPDDKRRCVYVGDEFYVNITVVRHRVNGTCRFQIVRYAEHIGGPHHGERHPISHATLRFVGENEMRDLRWPTPPDRYILGYEVDENNNYLDGRAVVDAKGEPLRDAHGNQIYRPRRPLLPDGVNEQEFTFFVVGRYFCNYLDDVFPRYIQGGERPNQTANVRAVLRRNKP